MAAIYARAVRAGKRTLESIPEKWRAAVEALLNSSADVAEWEQRESTNPYAKGSIVSHNGKTWESLIDGNVWEPGSVGAENLWQEVAQ